MTSTVAMESITSSLIIKLGELERNTIFLAREGMERLPGRFPFGPELADSTGR